MDLTSILNIKSLKELLKRFIVCIPGAHILIRFLTQLSYLKIIWWQRLILKFQKQAPAKKIIIYVPHLSTFDAVSNDVLVMRDSLQQEGYEVLVYASQAEAAVQDQVCSKKTFLQHLLHPAHVMIYHHCVYSEHGFHLVKNARCAIWFRYHNVTPPEFFTNYDAITTFATKQGRWQTQEFVKLDHKISKYVSDSDYNAQELLELGVRPEKSFVVPVFHRLVDFASCTENLKLKSHFHDGKLNVFFVGRVVPNKGHKHLLETLYRYKRNYGDGIRLIIAGDMNPRYHLYLSELQTLITQYDLASQVEFYGKASFQDIHTMYAYSHAFLLLSEHEGFCMPILEAQSHKTPIVAINRTAIKETLGKNQICFEKFDYDLMATTLHRIFHDGNLTKYLKEQGLENLKKYDLKVLTNMIIRQLQG